MNTLSPSSTTSRNTFQWKYWLIGLALFAGLLLSVFSWLDICVKHCSATQEYYLFGLPFAQFGILFFLVLNSLHFLSRRYPYLSHLLGWMLAASLGAEIRFIMVQKYEIGQWCPVCLGIAASLSIAAIIFLIDYVKNFKETIQLQNRGRIMHKIRQGLASLSFLVLGFLMAFVGISKPDFAEAARTEMKDRMAFGTKNSPVEIYFVTDWFCPSCQKVEPMIEKLYPEIKSKVAFYFIDYPIHKKSLNFSPYNLSFLVNDKSHYFKARQMLMDLTEKTKSPKDEDVEKFAKKKGLTFNELSFVDVKSGLEVFDNVVDQFQLHATPTIIISNPSRKQMVKLEGRDEISKEKILNAIEKLSPSN